jgi:hypothetical protein
VNDPRQIVLQSLPALIAYPDASWEHLLAALAQAGLTRAIAVEVGVFVPIAFGRALMASKFVAVLHSGYFRVGQEGNRPLMDEPLYAAAYELAWELFLNGDQLTYQQFIAVAGRSPELNQVDRMMDQGSKFSDILLGPAIITVPKLDDPGEETLWAEIVE